MSCLVGCRTSLLRFRVRLLTEPLCHWYRILLPTKMKPLSITKIIVVLGENCIFLLALFSFIGFRFLLGFMLSITKITFHCFLTLNGQFYLRFTFSCSQISYVTHSWLFLSRSISWGEEKKWEVKRGIVVHKFHPITCVKNSKAALGPFLALLSLYFMQCGVAKPVLAS